MSVWILCLLFFHQGFADQPHYPEVKIENGWIRGIYSMSSLGRQFIAFEGIPYAKPPIGNLRFEPPQEAKPWTGVWISRNPPPCLQYPHRFISKEQEIAGDEDCLYINVYTPNIDEHANLDVIVHIHGGAFMMAKATIFGPNLLMDRDIIFVNFNYRLGPLGFLSTEDSVVPGNNGMKDQVMALKWIKNNIQRFGGNPDSVTITGLSAGGASVHYHYVSPMSRGLFKGGISMSGTVLCPWTQSEANLEKAQKLATAIGCPTESTKKMVECMKTRPGYQIVAQVPLFLKWMYNPFTPFGPVIEKAGNEPFLNENPYTLLKEGKVYDLPWLTSVTGSEGLYPAAEFVRDYTILQDLEANWSELAPHLLDFNYTAESSQKDNIAKQVKAFYLKGQPISDFTFDRLVQMVGDRLFVKGAVEASQMQSKVNKSPVYFYYFRFRGKRSATELLSASNKNLGVAHGDDAIYLLSDFIPLDEVDRPMAEKMIDMWISFSKTGKPKMKGVKWEPVCSDDDKLTYLDIEAVDKMNMHSSDRLGYSEFWENLPINEKS